MRIIMRESHFVSLIQDVAERASATKLDSYNTEVIDEHSLDFYV